MKFKIPINSALIAAIAIFAFLSPPDASAQDPLMAVAQTLPDARKQWLGEMATAQNMFSELSKMYTLDAAKRLKATDDIIIAEAQAAFTTSIDATLASLITEECLYSLATEPDKKKLAKGIMTARYKLLLAILDNNTPDLKERTEAASDVKLLGTLKQIKPKLDSLQVLVGRRIAEIGEE